MPTTKIVNKIGGTNGQKKAYEVYQATDGKTFVARLVGFRSSQVNGPWSEPFETEAEAIKNAWQLWAKPIVERQESEAEYRRSGGY